MTTFISNVGTRHTQTQRIGLVPGILVYVVAHLQRVQRRVVRLYAETGVVLQTNEHALVVCVPTQEDIHSEIGAD